MVVVEGKKNERCVVVGFKPMSEQESMELSAASASVIAQKAPGVAVQQRVEDRQLLQNVLRQLEEVLALPNVPVTLPQVGKERVNRSNRSVRCIG